MEKLPPKPAVVPAEKPGATALRRSVKPSLQPRMNSSARKDREEDIMFALQKKAGVNCGQMVAAGGEIIPHPAKAWAIPHSLTSKPLPPSPVHGTCFVSGCPGCLAKGAQAYICLCSAILLYGNLVICSPGLARVSHLSLPNSNFHCKAGPSKKQLFVNPPATGTGGSLRPPGQPGGQAAALFKGPARKVEYAQKLAAAATKKARYAQEYMKDWRPLLLSI